MQPEVTHITTMVELWGRKDNPQSADLQRALHIARRCAGEADTPLWMRSLAWHLVNDCHEAVGWDIPKADRLSQCRAAAASVQHSCSLLLEETAGQIEHLSGSVLVLGALGAGRSLLGRWDAIPSLGAVLVPFDRDDSNLPSAISFNNHRGVIWASAGRLRDQLKTASTSATIGGREVLVPGPETIMARTRARDTDPANLSALVFTAAASLAVSTGKWAEAEAMARASDADLPPTELAIRLGIDHWLGLNISAGKRVAMAIKRAFSRSAA